MKMQKIYFNIVVILVIMLCGCNSSEEKERPFIKGKWLIDNKTSETFDVTINLVDLINNGEVFETLTNKVEANTISPISLMYGHYGGWDYQEWANEPLYIGDVAGLSAIITFNFSNGVCHTFEGVYIENDVRYQDSWVVVEQTKFTTEHTYTFTQEDYERIVALYE